MLFLNPGKDLLLLVIIYSLVGFVYMFIYDLMAKSIVQAICHQREA
jgi:hypothetical protein